LAPGTMLIELAFTESKADYLDIKSWLRLPGTTLTAERAGAMLLLYRGKGEAGVRRTVFQVTGRVEGHRGTQDVLHGKADERSSESDVLARGPGEQRGYSWLEDYVERLEGKEARREYYTRLEWAAPV
jgi:hypothetical protein